MDSIDYYNRYAVPYYEETVDASMEEVMKPFVELLSEESENAEVLDLGCGKVLEFSVSYREDLYYNRLEKISRRT